jgi:hypothetical protein
MDVKMKLGRFLTPTFNAYRIWDMNVIWDMKNQTESRMIDCGSPYFGSRYVNMQCTKTPVHFGLSMLHCKKWLTAKTAHNSDENDHEF